MPEITEQELEEMGIKLMPIRNQAGETVLIPFETEEQARLFEEQQAQKRAALQKQVDAVPQDIKTAMLGQELRQRQSESIPQEPGPFAQAIPEIIGGVAGGIATKGMSLPGSIGKALSKLGPIGRAINIPAQRAPQILGSATGGAVGRVGGEINRGETDPAALLAAGQESAIEQGAIEAVTSFVSPVAGRILNPIKREIVDKVADIAKFAKEIKAPVSPDLLTQTKFSNIVTRLARGSSLGVEHMQRSSRDALVAINDHAQSLVKQFEPKAGNQGIGVLKNVIDDIKTQFFGRKATDSLPAVTGIKEIEFGKIIEQVGGKKRIPLKAIKSSVAEIRKSSIDEDLLSKIDLIEKGLEASSKKTASLARFLRVRQQIGGATGKITGVAKDDISKLRQAFIEDLSSVLDDSQVNLQLTAEKNFAKESKFFNTGLMKSLNTRLNAGQESFALKELFSSKNVDDALELKSRISPDLWDSLRFDRLHNIISAATKPGRDFVDKLDPSSLNKILRQDEKAIKAHFGEDVFKALGNLSRLSELSLKTVTKDSSAGRKIFEGAVGLGAGSLIATNHPLAGIALLTGPLASKAIAFDLMRPNGLIRKLLLEGFDQSGFKSRATQGLLNFGGKAAVPTLRNIKRKKEQNAQPVDSGLGGSADVPIFGN